jgi:uncharacterized membrane protein
MEPPLGGPLEVWISRVLLGGVLLAAAIIFLGLARLLTMPPQGGEPATAAALIQQETHPTSLVAILDGVDEGRPTSLVRLGVLVLILTPVARVAMTVVLFLAQRDWAFVVLAAFVLLLLVLGLLGVLV